MAFLHLVQVYGLLQFLNSSDFAARCSNELHFAHSLALITTARVGGTMPDLASR